MFKLFFFVALLAVAFAKPSPSLVAGYAAAPLAYTAPLAYSSPLAYSAYSPYAYSAYSAPLTYASPYAAYSYL